MSINKEAKPACADMDDEEDLEMLRLMALQSRKNKTTSNPSAADKQQNLDDGSEDSDSSVDSLDRLIQDMDYELLDTPKEERVYSKAKSKSKKKEAKLSTMEFNSTSSKEYSDEVNPREEQEKIVNTELIANTDAKMVEAVGSRIPTLAEAVPVNVRNSNNPSHISRVTPERVTCKSIPFRSRSRSWSRESSPYRRARFSRSPERRTPSRSIFPDLTNVQLSPRALAFVYNNTGILIKRRDRRSSSSSNDYFSSGCSSRSRRSISPYPSRSYKQSSPQPSYSGQVQSTASSRRSRSNSRSKSRLALSKQRLPYKPHPRLPRRQKNIYKKETSHNRRGQKSCSISLSPSPEPMIKHPINFGRNNYIGNARNRIKRYDRKNSKPVNDKIYNGDLNKVSNKEENKLSNSNKVVNTNKTETSNKVNSSKVVESVKNVNSSTAMNTTGEQAQEQTIKPVNDKAVSNDKTVSQSAGTANAGETRTEPAVNESMDDGIELTIDTSIDDVWSSESSGDEREGRFKTNTKDIKEATTTKMSFSAKTTTKPPCVSLDEIINKDRSCRNLDDSRKDSSRFHRNSRDSWSQNKARGMRNSRMRFDRDRRTNNTHTKSSSSSSSKPLPKKECSDLKEKPVQKEIIPTEVKKPEPSSKTIISLRSKAVPVSKEVSERKPIVIDDKHAEALKVNKTSDVNKTDEDLRDTLHLRRVKSFGPANCPSSSRLVQSALIGAVTSQSGASKRINDSKQTRSEEDAINSSKKVRSSDTRRVRWIKPEEKPAEGEETSESGRLPVRLRLGDGALSVPRSSSSSRRRRNRTFANKHYAEDVHQV